MDRWAAYSPLAFNLLLIALLLYMLPSCDELQLDGKPKPSNVSRSGYQHAQKMRASMTHIFGRDFELGSASWVKDSRTGQTYGNPSVSEKVATYMVSLRNRKASVHCCVVFTFLTTSIDTSWGGGNECPCNNIGNSVYFSLSKKSLHRFCDQGIMKELYDFNHQQELWGTVTEDGNFVPPPLCPKDHPNAWSGKGGALARRALHAIYTVAFICLLRSDKVLKIRRNHITFLNDGTDGIVLTLPFRKTHQGGGMLLKVFHNVIR
jgi:hypothetical protein